MPAAVRRRQCTALAKPGSLAHVRLCVISLFRHCNVGFSSPEPCRHGPASCPSQPAACPCCCRSRCCYWWPPRSPAPQTRPVASPVRGTACRPPVRPPACRAQALIRHAAPPTAGGPCCPSGAAQLCVSGHYCTGLPETSHDYPTCLPVPPGCGQLGSKCCPVELLSEELKQAQNDTILSPFCYAQGGEAPGCWQADCPGHVAACDSSACSPPCPPRPCAQTCCAEPR